MESNWALVNILVIFRGRTPELNRSKNEVRYKEERQRKREEEESEKEFEWSN